ncbi:hypothetical protein [Azospirillum argentinense]|uniref:hypothetical protein n=1 Tax=Azospirillum argentinense TaxID=2970906 RepID=UPI0032DEC0B8
MHGTTFPDATEWSAEDSREARAEGWDLFDCDGSGNGRTQLHKADDADIFANDPAAWAFVLAHATRGSRLHAQALALLLKHNPKEATAIAQFCALPTTGEL